MAREGGGLVGQGADQPAGAAGEARTIGAVGTAGARFARAGEVAGGEALDEVGGALEGAVDVGAQRVGAGAEAAMTGGDEVAEAAEDEGEQGDEIRDQVWDDGGGGGVVRGLGGGGGHGCLFITNK